MKWSSSVKGTERDPGGMDPVIYRTREDISNGFNWISGFTLIKLSTDGKIPLLIIIKFILYRVIITMKISV